MFFYISEIVTLTGRCRDYITEPSAEFSGTWMRATDSEATADKWQAAGGCESSWWKWTVQYWNGLLYLWYIS